MGGSVSGRRGAAEGGCVLFLFWSLLLGGCVGGKGTQTWASTLREAPMVAVLAG